MTKELTAEDRLMITLEDYLGCSDRESFEILDKVMQWHKQECKKWALECVPEIENIPVLGDNSNFGDTFEFWNISGRMRFRDEIIENIEDKTK